jgi:hypothetical protein
VDFPYAHDSTLRVFVHLALQKAIKNYLQVVGITVYVWRAPDVKHAERRAKASIRGQLGAEAPNQMVADNAALSASASAHDSVKDGE